MVTEEAMESRLTAHSVSQRETFQRLIEQYEPAVRRLASAYLPNRVDREDLVQEIAVAIWQGIPAFRKESSERTWIYRIAHNVAISSAAKFRRSNQRESQLDSEFDCPSQLPDAERDLLTGEKRRALIESIRSLSARDRQIILLYLESLSYAEIEEVTGLSKTAVAARLTRIRAKLKEQIQIKGVRRA